MRWPSSPARHIGAEQRPISYSWQVYVIAYTREGAIYSSHLERHKFTALSRVSRVPAIPPHSARAGHPAKEEHTEEYSILYVRMKRWTADINMVCLYFPLNYEIETLKKKKKQV